MPRDPIQEGGKTALAFHFQRIVFRRFDPDEYAIDFAILWFLGAVGFGILMPLGMRILREWLG